MTGWWNNLINQGRTLLIALAIMLACLGGALFLVTNASYFLVDGRLMGVSQRIVEHDYLRILGYLQLPLSGETMRLDYLPTDAKVLRHFKDVRHLFLLGESITVGASLVSWWGLWWAKQRYQLWRLRGWLQWLLIGFLVAVILIGLNFEPVFLWFHYHAFSNQDWLFDPKKEPLINLWPTSFFMTLAISWGLLVEGLIYLIYRWVKKELRRFVFFETGLEETNDGRD
ncbi:TIGR01906 family membrane protein [Limosilactobacillus fermentum]|uniref:TIGR01906 family membrane protein n=1 Tax=Limosilactobacillus fermentum TaxID=1613 RepID=UPI001E538132|nr:TIGR01906 family membrane protein [Limosilactobacillus fermentum]MCC6110487.1 TIGR01906 family membrane protein [Limosilactobacillus fermentum]